MGDDIGAVRQHHIGEEALVAPLDVSVGEGGKPQGSISAGREPVVRLMCEALAVDGRDPRLRRTDAEPIAQSLDRGAVAAGHHLDAPVG
jgi:hypothetical protein